MKTCMRCGRDYGDKSNFCSECRIALPKKEDNFCENTACARHESKHLFSTTELTCDICGQATSKGKRVDALL